MHASVHNGTGPGTVLHISTFQFSGSTALSFLLNLHPAFTTIGHTTGWNFAEGEDFRCSCGALLPECPLYSRIAAAFAREALPFDFRDFGTEFKLSKSERLNRYLTGRLPLLQSSAVERIRDRIVSLLPFWSGALARQQLANSTLIRVVLEQSGARVFVDNSHDPFRLRHLRRTPGLVVRNLNLVRDPRGVVWSCIKNAGWSVPDAIEAWLNRQADMARVSCEFPDSILVHYEDLCEATDAVLSRIHRAMGFAPQAFMGDFKAGEHHILGNDMRLRGGGLRLDQQWRTSLRPEDQEFVESAVREFSSQSSSELLRQMLSRYVPSEGADTTAGNSASAQSGMLR